MVYEAQESTIWAPIAKYPKYRFFFGWLDSDFIHSKKKHENRISYKTNLTLPNLIKNKLNDQKGPGEHKQRV